MKLLVGIPALNEERTILGVIKNIPKNIPGVKKIDIVVVDDGSTDKTSQVVSEKGVLVLKHIIRRGLGGALKTIIAYAQNHDYDLLVTLDADGQHDPKELPKLTEAVIEKRKDVVIGTRWKKAKNPYSRYIINQLANILTYLIFGIWSSDSQSGFRAFSKRAIIKLKIQTDGMEVSSEFFKEIYQHKLKYAEVPIKAIYSDYSKSKGQQISEAPKVFFQLFFRLLR